MKFLICFICLFPNVLKAYSLQVKLKELKHEQGMIRYLLFNSPDGFPSDLKKSFRAGSVKAAEKNILINDLPEGAYALSVIHDENNNDILDTLIGIPTERFGFSNNPRIFFGPPGFEATKFDLKNDLVIKVEMKKL